MVTLIISYNGVCQCAHVQHFLAPGEQQVSSVCNYVITAQMLTLCCYAHFPLAEIRLELELKLILLSLVSLSVLAEGQAAVLMAQML